MKVAEFRKIQAHKAIKVFTKFLTHCAMDWRPRDDITETNLTDELQRKVELYTICTEMKGDTMALMSILRRNLRRSASRGCG